MKAKLKRQEEFIDVKVVTIEISGNIYIDYLRRLMVD
jgi:hypothetical protein